MKKIKLYVVYISLFSIMFPYIAKALSPEPPTAEQVDKWIQEQKDNPEPVVEYVSSLNRDGLKNATLGNCFDVYDFGKVDVNVVLDKNTYEPGDIVYIKGELKNNNAYPLPDLKIRGKIVKIEQEGDRRIVKTVDEIVLKDNINVNSLASKSIDEKYNIPFQAAKGEYEILLSVIQNDQINISGLTFTDDVYDFNPSFSIGGNNTEDIIIKQGQITVNDNPYDNLSFTPSYTEKQPVTIKVPIQNNTNEDREIEIQYEVYSWSDDLGKIEKELKQQKTIAKQGSSVGTYTIEESNKAVYYVKIKVKDTNTNTNTKWANTANIRFTNAYINEPGIVFVGFNTSPYSPEKELNLVTCINNTNDIEEETILENTLKDEKGKIIANSEYRGKLSGQIDGIYTKLPKDKKYNKLLVTSIIKDKNGNIINTVNLNYDCKDLDPSKCVEDKYTNLWLMLGLILGILILVPIIAITYRRYRIKKIRQ